MTSAVTLLGTCNKVYIFGNVRFQWMHGWQKDSWLRGDFQSESDWRRTPGSFANAPILLGARFLIAENGAFVGNVPIASYRI